MTKKITPEQIATAEELLVVLKRKFPNTFFDNAEEIRPLKIDIHRDIHAVLAHHYSKKLIRRALHLYINQVAYRNKLMCDIQRIDLEGNICGIVTEEHVNIGEEAKRRQERHQIQSRIAVKPVQKIVMPAPVSIFGRPILSLKRTDGQNGTTHIETQLKENTMDNNMIEPKVSTQEIPTVPGNLEVNIKIYTLPPEVQTVKNGWQQFVVEADGQMVLMKIRPKIWKKMQQANEDYAAWVVSITGKIGRRIKNGFELLQPAVQIFEKKQKSDKHEYMTHSSEDMSSSTSV